MSVQLFAIWWICFNNKDKFSKYEPQSCFESYRSIKFMHLWIRKIFGPKVSEIMNFISMSKRQNSCRWWWKKLNFAQYIVIKIVYYNKLKCSISITFHNEKDFSTYFMYIEKIHFTKNTGIYIYNFMSFNLLSFSFLLFKSLRSRSKFCNKIIGYQKLKK